MKMNLLQKDLKKLGAPSGMVKWAADYTLLEEAWADCKSAMWMLFLMRKLVFADPDDPDFYEADLCCEALEECKEYIHKFERTAPFSPLSNPDLKKTFNKTMVGIVRKHFPLPPHLQSN